MMMKVKTVNFSCKCSDLSQMVLLSDQGEILQEHEGYVPSCSLGGGDYVDIEIDNETGKIIGWVPIETIQE